MAAKDNVRRIRFSDELAELIDQQQGLARDHTDDRTDPAGGGGEDLRNGGQDAYHSHGGAFSNSSFHDSRSFLELKDYDSLWKTITVDFGTTGHITNSKENMETNGAGRYFPADDFKQVLE